MRRELPEGEGVYEPLAPRRTHDEPWATAVAAGAMMPAKAALVESPVCHTPSEAQPSPRATAPHGANVARWAPIRVIATASGRHAGSSQKEKEAAVGRLHHSHRTPGGDGRQGAKASRHRSPPDSSLQTRPIKTARFLVSGPAPVASDLPPQLDSLAGSGR